LELDKVDLRISRAAGENIHSSSRDDEVLFAVNGGFFDVRPSGRYFATGLLVSKGKELSPLSPHLSGILVVSEGRAQLLSPSDALPKWSQVDMAVQCRPRLLEPGGALGVHSDDKARAPRTAACIRDGGRTLDFVLVWGRRNPETGPGLYAVSQALRAFGCDSALNLDGGASTGMYLKGRPSADHFARGPVPWVIEGRRAPPQTQ
jgi:exopolysaccharide biosynthesis protein